jgi:DNA (cytosine-5)-methyltransferase 1
VLNAANYGVPQKRERVVFVGFRSDLGVQWRFPDETHSLEALLWDQRNTGEYWDRHKVSRAERQRFALDAAKPIVGDKPEMLAWRTVRDAIGGLPDPEHDRRRSASIDSHRFQPGARSYPGHTGSPLDAPAKTLKAGVHGVPGGENMLRRPDGSVRYFTIRESARLQTFPDAYKFHGAWGECMRQIGNAVPVELAHVVARNVATNLLGVT